MATTLEALDERLTAMEHEVAALRKGVVSTTAEQTPAERGARMLREARANQSALSAAVAQAFEQMGIKGEPIGAEKLQAMLAAGGIKPEDNEFSRGILAMREE